MNDSHRFYLRRETNFRYATVDEQAYTSPGVKRIEATNGESLEAGWSFIQPLFTMKLDVYNLRIKDEIIFDANAPTPVGGSFGGANVNAEASKRNGINLSSDVNVTDDIIIGAEYSFIDSEYTKGDNQGKTLPWVARHSGRLSMTYDITSQWQMFAEGIYTGSRYRNSDNSNSSGQLDAYWLGNIAINYGVDDWSAALRVDNLFNQKYPASAFSGGSYYPGDGRKLIFTGTYAF
ncbi:TonB-dependent receptor [Vibrio sp. PP-XX7]